MASVLQKADFGHGEFPVVNMDAKPEAAGGLHSVKPGQRFYGRWLGTMSLWERCHECRNLHIVQYNLATA